MDEVTLLVEGVLNKLKKLSLLNKQLKERILELEQQCASTDSQLVQQKARADQLEEELLHVQMAGKLGGVDSSGAKQKIDELLREIERISVLLNK